MKKYKIPYAASVLLLALCLVLPVSAELAERSETPEPDDSNEKQEDSWETVVPGLSLSEDEMRNRELRREYHVSLPTSFDFVMDPFEIKGKGQIYSKPFTVSNHGMEPLKITITDLIADTDGVQTAAVKIVSDSNREPLTVGESQELVIGKSEEAPPTIGYSISPHSLGNGADIVFRTTPVPQYVPGLGMVQQQNDTITLLSEETDEMQETLSDLKEAQILFRRMDQEKDDIVLSPKPAKPIVLILKENEDAAFELTGSLNPYPKVPWEKGDIVVSASFAIEQITPEEADRLLEQQKRGEEIAAEQEANKIIRYVANPEKELTIGESEEGPAADTRKKIQPEKTAGYYDLNLDILEKAGSSRTKETE